LAKGLSLGQLASSVGRTASSVRRWEKDEAVPPEDVVDRLAAVLDIDRGELEPDLDDGGEDVAPAATSPVDSRYAMLAPDLDQDTEALAVPVVSASEAREPDAAEAEESGDEPESVNPVLVWLSEFWDPEQRGRYYVRAALTTVVLVVMAFVLIWALGALLRALGEFWDSIGSSEDALSLLRPGL
jgi:transcriptional regulator with XRE-family HTH domain